MMRSLKLILWLAVLLFLAKTVYQILSTHWQDFLQIHWNFNAVLLVGLALSLLLVFVTNVFAWQGLLLILGAKISYGKNFRLWMLSNSMRLLPGSIWQYPSRVLMYKQAGVTVETTTKGLFLETLMSLGIGCLLSLPLIFSLDQSFLQQQYLLLIVLIGFVLFLFLLSSQKILLQLSSLLQPVLKQRSSAIAHLHLSFFSELQLLFLYLLTFLIPALALFFLLSAIQPLSLSFYPHLVSIYALSWLVGYITLIAPAGLGITEGMLAWLLSLSMTAPVAILVAIIFRLLLLLFEGVLVLFSYLLHRQTSN